MSSNNAPATVYDVLQIPPGTRDQKAWVDLEFEAVVSNVRPGSGRKPTKAKLSDPHNPNVSIEASFFGGRNVAGFAGKICLFSGQGMTMGEYNGVSEITIGDKTHVNVQGPAPAGGGNAPTQTQQRGPRDDTRGGGHEETPPPPAATGPRPIEGATVGMALKEASTAILKAHELDSSTSVMAYLKGPNYSKDLFTLTSDIIRVSQLIQSGKLAPSAKDRADPDFEKKQAAAKEAARVAAEDAERKRKEAEEAEERRRAAANQRPAAQQENLDEDVPF